MSNDDLKNRILKVVPEAEFSEEGSEFLNVTVTPEHLHKLAEDLKNNAEILLDYMFCLTGVDWVSHLMVVYHLE